MNILIEYWFINCINQNEIEKGFYEKPKAICENALFIRTLCFDQFTFGLKEKLRQGNQFH